MGNATSQISRDQPGISGAESAGNLVLHLHRVANYLPVGQLGA